MHGLEGIFVMSKIQSGSTISLVKPEELTRYITQFLNEVVQVVNGRLEFNANIRGNFRDVSFTAANTNKAVSHGLGRTPQGYIVTKLSANMVVYDGSSDNNEDTIYLRASAIGNATIFIF